MKMKTFRIVSLCLGVALLLSFGLWRWNWDGAKLESAESSLAPPAAGGSYRSEEAIAVAAGIQHGESAESVDCQYLLQRPEVGSRFLSGEKRLQIGAFFRSLDDRGYTRLERDLVADRAGLERHSNSYESYASIYRDKANPFATAVRNTLPPLTARFPSSSEQMQAEDLLNDAGLDALIQIARDNPSLLQARWFALTDMDANRSVLGQFIRQRGPELYRSLDTLARSADLPLGLHELAVAIEQGASPADFLGLLELSEADPKEAWRNKRGGQANLAVVAALNLRPGILRLLIEHGTNPVPSRSVLDELALAPPPQPQQIEALADVVSQLTIAGDRPFYPSTLSNFRQWLPEFPELELHPETATALQTPDVEKAALELAALVAEWDRKVNAAASAEMHCRETLLAQDHSAHEERGLAAKLRHQEALEQQQNQRIEHALQLGEKMKKQAVLELDPDHLQKYLKLQDAIANAKDEGRWDDALRLMEEQELDDPRMSFYGSELQKALYSGAPLDVILTLIERGGSLPENAILNLARGLWDGAAEAAAELERLYGMDVHFIDDEGRNAFSFIAERFWQPPVPPQSSLNMNALEMTGFLLSRSVSVKPNFSGLDPLDSVLLKILDSSIINPAGVIYARILIDHGAPVEASHLQLTERISLLDPKGYEHLVSFVPELSPKSSSHS